MSATRNPNPAAVSNGETAGQTALPGIKTFVRIADWITNEKFELINATDRINEIVSKSGVKDGIVHLQSLHTTMAVFINNRNAADVKSLHHQ